MDHPTHQRYIIWEPFLLAVMVVIGMIIGNKMEFYHKEQSKDLPPPVVRTSGEVEQLLRFIESKYVDEVDGKSLTQTAIDAILTQLDPHTQYLSPRLREELEEDMNGAYTGIGLEKIRFGDSLFVTGTTIGAPAQEAGIEPGDQIVAVRDSIYITQNLADDSLSVLLEAADDSKVSMTIRKLSGDTLKVHVGQAKIPLPALDLGILVQDSVGLIKINRFSDDLYKDFMQTIEDLANEGMDDLIIDLRNNPGGYLQEAVKILSQLIEDKESLLVYTEGVNSKRTDYKSTGRQFYSIDDIIILTDAGSASASEIMAGALQDLDRGLVVGRRTFGKGLVQEQYRLTNGAALRLTTARYFTPSGRLIQRDYSDLEYYEQEAINRDKTGETANEDLIPMADSAQHFTSAGRVVYGGGGIVPDVFVAKENPFSVEDWPHISYYVQLFIVQNLSKFDGLPTDQESFVKAYDLESSFLESLYLFVEGHWPLAALTTQQGRKSVKDLAKAYLGKMHYNDNQAFFKSLYSEDVVLAQALKLIAENKVDPLLSDVSASIHE